jgi:hypothetical protein
VTIIRHFGAAACVVILGMWAVSTVTALSLRTHDPTLELAGGHVQIISEWPVRSTTESLPPPAALAWQGLGLGLPAIIRIPILMCGNPTTYRYVIRVPLWLTFVVFAVPTAFAWYFRRSVHSPATAAADTI